MGAVRFSFALLFLSGYGLGLEGSIRPGAAVWIREAPPSTVSGFGRLCGLNGESQLPALVFQPEPNVWESRLQSLGRFEKQFPPGFGVASVSDRRISPIAWGPASFVVNWVLALTCFPPRAQALNLVSPPAER